MKFLIVVLVVGVALWLLLRGRKTEKTVARDPARERGPLAMVACAHCGVHIPRREALLDQRGAFCSETHQLSGPHKG